MTTLPASSARPAVVAAAVVVGLLGAGAALVGTTRSAFSASSAAGASFTSTTVTISDNDGGTAMFSTSDLVNKGSSASDCITVTDSGTGPADVALYASAYDDSRWGIDSLFTLTVVAGTDDGTGSCTLTGTSKPKLGSLR